MPARALGVFVAVCLGCAWSAPGAAQVLVPQWNTQPGELGPLLGGAQAALASGGEALWSNPAGLAHERERRLTVSGDALRWRTAAAEGPAAETVALAPASLAYVQALGRRPGYPRFALGVSLALRTDQRWPTPVESSRPGTSASLPPGLPSVEGVVQASFDDSVSVTATGDATGALTVLAPGVGLGLALADWVRFGLALELQRVSLRAQVLRTAVYGATASGGAHTLDGQSQLAWSLAGEAWRLAPALGAQFDLTPGVQLGIAWQLPTATVAGSGRLHYQRSDTFAWDVGGGPQSATAAVLVSRAGLPFRLEAPQRLQVGLALRSDRFLIEFDVYHSAALAPYDVLPESQSGPPSTIALALPAQRTSTRSVLGTAVGMAYARSARTSLLLGLAVDPAPVPPDDPVFRSVTLITVSGGVYHVRGGLSYSLGVRYRDARQAAASVVPPDGGEPVPTALALREVAAHTAVSLGF